MLASCRLCNLNFGDNVGNRAVMLGNRRHEERGINRLTKQSSLPTLKQLQGMQAESLRAAGRITQLPFGDPPEDYSLAVFKDRTKGDLHWALYREDGNQSMLVWDQVSQDPGFIHQLITAQFPGFDLKPVALRSQASFQAQTQGETGSNSLAEQQNTTMRMRGKATLEGDLQNMQMPNVLQSIGMSKGTGRLEVETPEESATVYFDDGSPIHCVLGQLSGSVALIELVGWEEGEFRFYPEAKSETKTIKKRLDTLLMEGAALDDQYKLIKQRNIGNDTYLIRNHASITEQLFEQMLEKGTGADMVLQKRIYQMIDNKSRLIDILRKFNVSKQDWVPIIFNFATCNLVTFVDELPDSKEKPKPEANIDWTQARAAERALIRQDTGLYAYSSFLYLLEREFLRWERFGRPVSVILLECSTRPVEPGGIAEPLTIAGVKEVAERINKMKRKTDLFAHYETFGFALLLPETESASARNFAARLAEMLMTSPLSGGLGGLPVLASVGVACLPDDCNTLGSLLAMARPARPQ